MPDKKRMPLVEVVNVECARLGGSKLLVRIEGAWQGRRSSRNRALLIVEVDGRRHRYPQMHSTSSRGSTSGTDAWSAKFSVPAWLGPHLDGNMSLAVAGDNRQIPLPPFATGRRPVSAASHQASSNGHARIERRPPRSRASSTDPEPERDLLPELEKLREAMRSERAARERQQAIAGGLAKRVADVHAQNTKVQRESDELVAERDSLLQERERLAAELESLRQELMRGGGVDHRSEHENGNGHKNGVASELAA